MKKKKESVFAPNIVWFTYLLVTKTYLMLKCPLLTYDLGDFRKNKNKESAIVVFNHASNSDSMIVTGAAGFQRKLSFVITSRFNLGIFHWVIRIGKQITKNQFVMDAQSVMKMRRFVQNGATVTLAPAGQIALTGEVYRYDAAAMVKFAKAGKADIISAKTQGAYYAEPKWATSKRRYPIHVTMSTIITKEELPTLSDEEIFARLKKAVSVDDIELQEKKPIKIKGKALCEGLENVLYICPECGKRYNISTHKNTISCTCGLHYTMNEYGTFECENGKPAFKNENEWFRFQYRELEKDIENPDFLYEIEATLKKKVSPTKLKPIGHGKLILTKDKIVYEGTEFKENVVRSYDLKTIQGIPFSPAKRLNIPNSGDLMDFLPDDKRTITNFVQYVDVIKGFVK